MEEPGKHGVDVQAFDLVALKEHIPICCDSVWEVQVNIYPYIQFEVVGVDSENSIPELGREAGAVSESPCRPLRAVLNTGYAGLFAVLIPVNQVKLTHKGDIDTSDTSLDRCTCCVVLKGPAPGGVQVPRDYRVPGALCYTGNCGQARRRGRVGGEWIRSSDVCDRDTG